VEALLNESDRDATARLRFRATRPGLAIGPRGIEAAPSGELVSRRLIGFALLLLAVVALPLGVILLGETTPGRGLAVEFGVALGFIGLAMLGLQSVLTARYPRVSGALLQFHRQAGLVAFALVAAHPVILIAARARLLGLPRPAGRRVQGAGAVDGRRRACGHPGDVPVARAAPDPARVVVIRARGGGRTGSRTCPRRPPAPGPACSSPSGARPSASGPGSSPP
jgi:hypothetical protein